MKASELINLIARDLPEGYTLTIEIERNSGVVALDDPFGDELDFPSNREDMQTEVLDALKYAIEHDKEHYDEYFTESDQ